ncbi:MAG: hypothetical protein P4L87_16665, partial [Formivibrio sp.]|nr:hypothetical protein [Formivibrio sp.]
GSAMTVFGRVPPHAIGIPASSLHGSDWQHATPCGRSTFPKAATRIKFLPASGAYVFGFHLSMDAPIRR